MIGGHFDSVPSSPGVDDNGSGCTAVLELARLLKQNKCSFDKTIIFALFDLEENVRHTLISIFVLLCYFLRVFKGT